MRRRVRLILAVVLPLLAIPCALVATFWLWNRWDDFRSSREVAAFIEQHWELLREERSDPAVHTFDLAHDTKSPQTLLITIDVDDIRTFERLEDKLNGIYALQRRPHWSITIRSNEKLSDNPAYGVFGIGDIVLRVVLSTTVALFVGLAVQVTALRLIPPEAP